MFSDDHTLIGPYHNDSSDPNCYCSCKDWQLDSPLKISGHERTLLHLQHQIDKLAELYRAGGEEADTEQQLSCTCPSNRIDLLCPLHGQYGIKNNKFSIFTPAGAARKDGCICAWSSDGNKLTGVVHNCPLPAHRKIWSM